jgi:hypothetical protein
MSRFAMRALRVVVVTLSIVLPAMAVPAAAVAEESIAAPQAGVPVTLVVKGILNSQKLVQWPSYPVTRLRDLKLVARWYVPGVHVQRLDIFAPDGSLYRRVSARFRHVSTREAGTKVITLLPVGGTWITEYSLLGTWEVRVYMDNARTPVLTQSFVLDP